jgi:hypothetical protein
MDMNANVILVPPTQRAKVFAKVANRPVKMASGVHVKARSHQNPKSAMA